MSDDGVPQHYWNALLSLTARAQSEVAEESVSSVPGTKPGPLSAENRQWLEAAMKDLVESTDPSKILDGVMGGLLRLATTTELTDTDREQVQDLAYRLEDLLQYADLAPKFYRLGGFDIIMRFLDYVEYKELRLAGAEMLITMCENNPQAQQLVIDHPLFDHVFTLITDVQQDVDLRYKLLGSASAMIRSFPPAYDRFLERKGGESLACVVRESSNEDRLRHKALRVLTSISYTYRDDPLRASSLKELLASSYAVLSAARGEDSPELAYVREYLLTDVQWKDLKEETRTTIVAALAQEEAKQFAEQRQADIVRILLKKLQVSKMG